MAGSDKTINEIVNDYVVAVRNWVTAEEVHERITSSLLDELFFRVRGPAQYTTVSVMKMIVEDHLRQSNDRVKAKCQEQLRNDKYFVGLKESSVSVAGIVRTIKEIVSDYMAAVRVSVVADEEHEKRTNYLLGELFLKLEGPAQGTVGLVMDMVVEDHLRQSSDRVKAKCREQLKSRNYVAKSESCSVIYAGFEEGSRISEIDNHQDLIDYSFDLQTFDHHFEDLCHDTTGRDAPFRSTIETMVANPKEMWNKISDLDFAEGLGRSEKQVNDIHSELVKKAQKKNLDFSIDLESVDSNTSLLGKANGARNEARNAIKKIASRSCKKGCRRRRK